MTVSELISALTQLPQDKQVILHDTSLDLWVKCEAIDPNFDLAVNAIALQGGEVPDSPNWFEDEEE